jgi:ketosteroid isomerase-like protein
MEFVARVERLEFLEVMPEFYAVDAQAQENSEPPRVGLEAMMANERRALSLFTFERMHAASVVIDGDRAAINWVADMRLADGRRIHNDEIAYQLWRDGKIVFERYYYDPGQRAPR